ncbi:unnamed protein product [Amoebophrya sp. A120]|nr:unnamed protein product [Amoebophrya sp. A120]|eukprot:GSA120T00014959001.1
MTSPQFRKTASRKMGGAVFGRVLMLWSFLLGSSLFGSALEKSHVSSGPRVGRHSAGRAHVVAVHRQPSDGHGGDSLPLPASSGSRARARVGLGGPGRGSAAVRQPSSSREDGFVDLELGGNLHSAAGRASASRVSERNGLLLRAAGSAASAALTLGEAVGRRALSAASRVGEAVDRFNLSDDQEIEDLREFNAFEQKLADCWDNNSDGAVSLKSFWFGPHHRASLFNKLPPPEEAIQIGIDIAPQEEARKLWEAVGDLVKSFHFPILRDIIEGRVSAAGLRPRGGDRSHVELPFRDESRTWSKLLMSRTWSRDSGPLADKRLLPQNIRQSTEGKFVPYLVRNYNDTYWDAILGTDNVEEEDPILFAADVSDRADANREAAIKVGPQGMRVDDIYYEDSSNGTSTAVKKISWTVDYDFRWGYTPLCKFSPRISYRSRWKWSFLVDFVESAPRLLRVDIEELDFKAYEIERPHQGLEVERREAVPLRSLRLS